MENQNRTLASVLNQNPQHNQNNPTTTSYNTYLSTFAINLAWRFPDVTNLDSIDYETVEGIARFSGVCSNIAIQVWDEISNVTPSRPYRRVGQQQRAA